MLRTKVIDEDRHQRQQLIHGELIPERVDELDTVRSNDWSRVHVGVLQVDRRKWMETKKESTQGGDRGHGDTGTRE